VTVVFVAGFTTGGLLLGATRHAAALETPLARWFADQPGADTGRVGPVLLEGRLRADATATDYGVVLRLTVARVGRTGAMRTTSGGVRLSVGERAGGRAWPPAGAPGASTRRSVRPRLTATQVWPTRRGGRRCGEPRCSGR